MSSRRSLAEPMRNVQINPAGSQKTRKKRKNKQKRNLPASGKIIKMRLPEKLCFPGRRLRHFCFARFGIDKNRIRDKPADRLVNGFSVLHQQSQSRRRQSFSRKLICFLHRFGGGDLHFFRIDLFDRSAFDRVWKRILKTAQSPGQNRDGNKNSEPKMHLINNFSHIFRF